MDFYHSPGLMVDDEIMGQSDPEAVHITSVETDGDEVMQDVLMADDPVAVCDLIFNRLPDDPKILVDDHYTWNVQDWKTLGKKERSPVFVIGDIPWRILLFPFGNNVDHCSVYLEHGFNGQEGRQMPPNWSACVQLGLVMWNPKDPSVYVQHTAHHRFTKEESDWGFTRFYEIRKLLSPAVEGGRPMIEDEQVNITAYVRIVEDETGVLWHNFNNYNSKAETGYVGLKNQGATCYLNSLLQSLYVTNAFRKAIYNIPTESEQSSLNSAYSLQRLFYMLQTSDQAVSTLELTKSFGWDSKQVFEQQDVQELSRKLMERMEEKMKGTSSEKVLPDLFSGKIKTYISCINVDYESSRIEDFWDIQLNVSGNKNLEESFQDYIQVEKLDGDNQYYAGEEHKLQDAKKGVIFTSFPDVLHLQLKRFEYDFERDALMKINDRHEFPEEFDASPYLSEDAEKTDEPWIYQLHGVLVHSGVLDAGHYYAYLKPEKDGWFYRFDDDRVVKATRREVLEENYGGYLPQPTNRRLAGRKNPVMRMNNAYMLVYIRKSRVDKVLCEVKDNDIPEHIKARHLEEVAIREAMRKEREEAHLYIPVRYITPETFRDFGGTDLGIIDRRASDKPASLLTRFLREWTVKDVRTKFASDFNVPWHKVRLWAMVNRQNKTVRPDSPLLNDATTIEQAFTKGVQTRDPALRLFIEIHPDPQGPEDAPWPNYNVERGVIVKSNNILVFLKYFDIETQQLRGVGHVYLDKTKRIEEVLPLIRKFMGWPASMDKITLFEEIKPTMVEVLQEKTTVQTAELVDGDIICFQRGEIEKPATKSDEESKGPKLVDHFDDAQEYYDYLYHRRELEILPHPTKMTDDKEYPHVNLEISIKAEYGDLLARIAAKIGVPQTHIRLWSTNLTTGLPKMPLRSGVLVQSMLPATNTNYGGSSGNSLFYEVMQLSVEEMETKVHVKLIWLPEGVSKEEPVDVLVNKNSQVKDVIAAFIDKTGIPSEEEVGPLRLYETAMYRFFREVPRDFTALNLNTQFATYVERIPKEELEVPTDERRYMKAMHFHTDPVRVHGVPFRFLLKDGESFSETKKRLEKITGFKGKSFEKIKFAMISRSQYSNPVHYLEDDDILSDLVRDGDDVLGLDHPDRRQLRSTGDLFLK